MMKRSNKKRGSPKSKGGNKSQNRRGYKTAEKDVRRDREIVNTSRREMQADEREARDLYKSKENDWQWYAQNAQLIKDYASYPFGVPLGTMLNTPDTTSLDYAVPGVMIYHFSPTMGYANSPNDPINIAMRRVYTFVRHENSGHTNYDAPDLMLYLMAMDSVFMYHAFLKRLLGIILDYTPLNRYYPDSIIEGMGVSAADMRKHITDLRGFINIYAVKAASLCIPNSMSYMARHSWMCEGLYTDSSAAKSQTYLYTPYSYYKFGLDSNQAGQLERVPFNTHARVMGEGTLLTFEDLVTFGNNLIDPLLTNEDINIMSGDILKAFGDGGTIRATGVGDGYLVLPVYTQEVLSQMENATIFNGVDMSSVTQDVSVGGGYLISNPSINYILDTSEGTNTVSDGAIVTSVNLGAMYNILGGPKYLNFHHDSVTPEDVMVATRLMCSTNVDTPANVTLTTPVVGDTFSYWGTKDSEVSYLRIYTPSNQYVRAGSEIINFAVMIVKANNNGGPSYDLYKPISTIKQLPLNRGNTISPLTVTDQFTTISMLASFDWHPCVYYVPTNVNGATITMGFNSVYPSFDLDNYTVIDERNLQNMHQAALLSEFSVPGTYGNVR